MRISDITTPEVYRESSDFRFFLKWFESALSKIDYDTKNLPDIYDPLRVMRDLIWMLADTMGFKYDDRLPAAYNRLVLVYFMSMIRNRGSKDGVTLAAECNLAQFNILKYGEENDILYNRLEDTSIPVNSAYVTPHVAEGYIDVVYFSDKLPINACIEYVRPLGMYLIENPGVRYDARTRLTIDARLTDLANIGMSIGATHVGHYSREDYARIQKLDRLETLGEDGEFGAKKKINRDIRNEWGEQLPGSDLTKRQIYQMRKAQLENSMKLDHTRQPVYYRNSDWEEAHGIHIGDEYREWPVQDENGNYIPNPGFRALYSLQLCNNEHIVKSLIDISDDDIGKIFGLGYHPMQNELDYFGDDFKLQDVMDDDNLHSDIGPWNLRYDQTQDIDYDSSGEVSTISGGVGVDPKPAVNPIMSVMGDAMSLGTVDSEGRPRYMHVVDRDTTEGIADIDRHHKFADDAADWDDESGHTYVDE